jgi:hypothetical protein
MKAAWLELQRLLVPVGSRLKPLVLPVKFAMTKKWHAPACALYANGTNAE